MLTHFWGRYQKRIGSPLGSLAAALFGLSLLFQSPVVSADSTPYPARLQYQGYIVLGSLSNIIASPILPAIEQACDWVYGHYIGVTSTFFIYDAPLGQGYGYAGRPSQGYAGGSCGGMQPDFKSGTSIFGGWRRYADCFNGGQVDDATVATPMCSCPAGRMFPPGGLVYGGPPCVPDTTPSCPIDPIPPYTPDPYPALIEELTPRMQTALSCLQAAIGGQGGSSSFKSGYRPADYNAHIQAVFDQKDKLKNRGPECADRKAELAVELSRHDLGKERPGDNSLHIIREAFDLGSTLNRQVTNGLAISCNVFAPIPITDRNHFEHAR